MQQGAFVFQPADVFGLVLIGTGLFVNGVGALAVMQFGVQRLTLGFEPGIGLVQFIKPVFGRAERTTRLAEFATELIAAIT